MDTNSLLVATFLAYTLGFISCVTISLELEDEMRHVLRHLINTTLDEDGEKAMIPGMARAAFHDSILGFDGCVDMRRQVQSANNGIENTWKPLRGAWRRLYDQAVSFADFAALATIVATEMAAENAVDMGMCTPDPQLSENDCIPKIQMMWGRITCHHPQKVNPLRPIPNADNEPYKFHKDELGMNEEETICIMGGHTLGKMRLTESGFNGSFTSRPQSLDNEYFKRLLNQSYSQYIPLLHKVTIDNSTQLRRQWLSADGKALTHVDIRLLYKFKPDERSRPNCYLPPGPQYKKITKKCPIISSAQTIIQELAGDNKKFLKCYGDAMKIVLHNGYESKELVPTGTELPIPRSTPPSPFTTKAGKAPGFKTKPPSNSVQSTSPPTTTLPPPPTTDLTPATNPDTAGRARRPRPSSSVQTTSPSTTALPTTASPTTVGTTTLSKKQIRQAKVAKRKAKRAKRKEKKKNRNRVNGRNAVKPVNAENTTKKPKRKVKKIIKDDNDASNPDGFLRSLIPRL